MAEQASSSKDSKTVEVALTPKSIKQKKTSTPEFQTPSKMTAEQSSSQRAAREAPVHTAVYKNCTFNAAVFNNQCDQATSQVADSNMNIGGSHVNKDRDSKTVEVALTPKAMKRKNTPPSELQTPSKKTAEQASSQGERLEDVFQDDIIQAFADINSFKKFARSKNGLCLDQSDIKTIAKDHEDSVEEQKVEMLFKWREIEGEKATVPNIRHLLQKYSTGDKLTDYIVLGNGTFGFYKNRFLCEKSKVYLGEQISEVAGIQTRAIKFVLRNKKNLREAEILVKLGNHVNVVSIIHADIHHGDPHDYIYIAMEHSWTKTVRNMIEECIKLEKPFHEFTAWNLVEQLMRAVEFLHSHNIIHRDVKPDNILASDDWRQFKLTDYGLSKEIKDGSATIQTNANTGTEGYRSRETYDPDAKITAKVDVFSAGATIGEIMANGKHPFGKDRHLWSYNIVNNKNLDLSHLCVSDKGKVAYFIKRMLEMDPVKRPTAKEVLNDVSIYFQTFQLKNQQTTADGSLATTSKAITELCITEKEVNAIAMFNLSDVHLYSYKLSTKEWSRMQEFPENDLDFATVVSGKHIYISHYQEVRQLEYSNPAAEWKEMSSMIEDHGYRPPAVVLNGLIYICGRGYSEWSSRSVERYDAALDRWDHMYDMNIARSYHCVVATEDHIYCMGGQDDDKKRLLSVERFDETSNKWEFVESTPRSFVLESAAVVKNLIYVTMYTGEVLCYDIQNNSWSEIKLKMQWPFEKNDFLKILAIDEELYIIGIMDESRKNEDEDVKYAIYLLEPETKQMTLVEEFEDKVIDVSNCFAMKL